MWNAQSTFSGDLIFSVGTHVALSSIAEGGAHNVASYVFSYVPEGGVSDAPSAERLVAGRQMAEQVDAALARLPDRARDIFHRSRIGGQPQREIAREMGISVSTVESDLRKVYLALAELRERFDEE